MGKEKSDVEVAFDSRARTVRQLLCPVRPLELAGSSAGRRVVMLAEYSFHLNLDLSNLFSSLLFSCCLPLSS